MRTIKKVTVAVLFIVLTLNMVSASALQAFPKDVEGTPYENVAKKLIALKIFNYSEDGFHPDREITRADFIAVALRLCGYDDEFFSGKEVTKSYFVDVRTDMWYAPYVEYAVELGLINGSNGYFEPDSSITYDQAAKIVVSLLGYSYFAESKGGFPFGYNSMASQIGLFKGLKPDSSAINRGDVAILINNALNAEALDVQSLSADGDTTYQKGKLMQSKLKIYSGKAVMFENSISGLTYDSTLANNYVKIGNYIYHVGKTNAADLLGYYVEFYFTHDDDSNEDTLLYVTKAPSVSELTVKASDIVSVSGNYIEYENMGKITKASLKPDFTVIYNNKYITSFSLNLLKPADGYLTLVENDGGSYDTVFVNSFTNVVVNAIEPSEYRVYDKLANNASLVLDQNDSLKKISIVDPAGLDKEFSDIKVGSVLSTFISQDEQYIKAVINSVKEDIAIFETTDSGDEFIISADTVSYKLSKGYYQYLSDNNKNNNTEFAIGEKLTVFLDLDGNVAWHEITVTSNVLLAYLVNAAKENSLNAPVQVKLFTRDGKHEIHECALNVKIDGNVKKTSEDILAILRPNDVVNNMLISYKFDSEGKINYIDTPTRGENESEISLFSNYTAYGISDGEHIQVLTGDDTKYKSSNKSIGYKILLNDGLPIFSVPTKNAWEYPENYFSIRGLSSFNNDNSYAVESYLFDPKSFSSAALVMYVNSEGMKEIGVETTMAVVKKTSVAMVDGEQKDKLTLIKDGKEISVVASEADTFKNLRGLRYTSSAPNDIYVYRNLQPGDVIRYETQPDGTVGTVQLVVGTLGERADQTGSVDPTVKDYTIDPTRSATTGASVARYGQTRLVMKNVYEKSEGNIKVADYVYKNADTNKIEAKDITSVQESELEVHRATSYRITVVDCTNNIIDVRAGNIDDLIDYRTSSDNYSTILMHVRWGDARGIVVLKGTRFHINP